MNCEHGDYYLDKGRIKKTRNATIIYSGGDDVFIVGSWDDYRICYRPL